jgi:MATE family multidrug resistance protein
LIWCILFISYLKWGVFGAALATNITYILNMIGLEIYIRFSKETENTRMAFDKSCLAHWNDYLRIGIPGACMVCFEWWAFEFLAIASGYISVAALAAEVVIINIVSFIFMLPLGISFSASALTGNYLGAGKINIAKRLSSLSIIFGLICISFVILLMHYNTEKIARLFTNEPEVVEITKSVMWVLLLYIFSDVIHGI